MVISSPAFTHQGDIPATYTCDGGDISPALQIGGVPEGAKSLALIFDDPDAPQRTWVHWLLWNIDPSTIEISESSVPEGAVQGRNSWQKNNYGGPCPPAGNTHHYYFKLYALDTILDLKETDDKKKLKLAMEDHIIEHASIIGMYGRK